MNVCDPPIPWSWQPIETIKEKFECGRGVGWGAGAGGQGGRGLGGGGGAWRGGGRKEQLLELAKSCF